MGAAATLTVTVIPDGAAMTFANTLEAFPRLSWGVGRSCRAYLRPFRSLAIPGEQSAFARCDAQCWEFWK
jgi:hypothetical protein